MKIRENKRRKGTIMKGKGREKNRNRRYEIGCDEMRWSGKRMEDKLKGKGIDSVRGENGEVEKEKVGKEDKVTKRKSKGKNQSTQERNASQGEAGNCMWKNGALIGVMRLC